MLFLVIYVILLMTVLVLHGLAPPPLLSIQFDDLNNNSLPDKTTFRYRYLTRLGQCLPFRPNGHSIRIRATGSVWEKAVIVTCITLAKITKYMPEEVFQATSKTKGVGIFTTAETLAVYPENTELADRPECFQTCNGSCNDTCTFDGRKYSEVAGLTNSISLSNMESILCLPFDIYQGAENILTHEFAHLVHKSLSEPWKSKILAAYETAKSKTLWRMSSYAMTNEYEYFAVATEAFFHDVIRTDTKSTGGMNMCDPFITCRNEEEARRFLKLRDPNVFECLSYIFTENRPDLLSGL